MTDRFPVRVYYEDTDMGGIVYHANYLRYIERARSDWVRRQGVDQNALRDAGTVFVVRDMTCDFVSTARLDDDLAVETEIQTVTGARLILKQTVFRDAEAIFQAVVTVVSMRNDGRPCRLPAEIRAISPKL